MSAVSEASGGAVGVRGFVRLETEALVMLQYDVSRLHSCTCSVLLAVRAGQKYDRGRSAWTPSGNDVHNAIQVS